MTDMITVSRKEIEALQRWQDDEEIANNCYEDDDGCFILYDDLRALLDKAEVSEPVAYIHALMLEKRQGLGCEVAFFKPNENSIPLYTSPPDQSAKIAELTAKNKELEKELESLTLAYNFSQEQYAKEIAYRDKELAKLTNQVDILEELQDEYLDKRAELTAKCEKMREALNSYGEKASSINRYLTSKSPNDTALLALVTELSLDAGKRAIDALATVKGE